ncbi:MAG: hypothetical protein K9N55_16890 [Phycisphaerae bacterium]|nr:hypothetical protein [Phycisphaerae bacterium]
METHGVLSLDSDGCANASVRPTLTPLDSGAVLSDLTCAALARTHEAVGPMGSEETSSFNPACPLAWDYQEILEVL